MKKALLFAPMGSVHRRFNKANIEALHDGGYEIHLLANFDNGDGPEIHNQRYINDCIKSGIKIHSFPFVRASLFKNLKLIPKVKALLKEENFDIVHAHTETGGILLRLSMIKAANTRYCYTPHGMSFYKGSPILSHFVYKTIERWICGSMQKNIAMNSEELGYLNKWNKRTAKFVHGIGLNLSNFKSDDQSTSIRKDYNIEEDSTVILSVGELNENKNHSAVIKALSRLKDKYNFHYIICGVGSLKQSLEKLITQYSLNDKVILAGYRSDIPRIIKESDIFVFPSFHEGLPVSVLEAMAGGLPLAISRIRGNVDLVNDTENGYLFNPSNAEEIEKSLEFLLRDKAKCKVMGSINMDLVKQYDFTVVKKELSDIYFS